jgi:hypothetical protein
MRNPFYGKFTEIQPYILVDVYTKIRLDNMNYQLTTSEVETFNYAYSINNVTRKFVLKKV